MAKMFLVENLVRLSSAKPMMPHRWQIIGAGPPTTHEDFHMKVIVARVLTSACLLAGLGAMPVQAAGDRGSDSEAQEMVKKAVALIKSAGPDKAYKAFTEHPDGAFKDRDLYVFVYNFAGDCLAQGANPKMVGKNLIDDLLRRLRTNGRSAVVAIRLSYARV